MKTSKRAKAAKITKRLKAEKLEDVVRFDPRWTDEQLLRMLANEPRLVLAEEWERKHAKAVLLRDEPCASDIPDMCCEVKVHNCPLGSDRLPITLVELRRDGDAPVLCGRRISKRIWWVTLRWQSRAKRYEWRDAGDEPRSARGTVEQICKWLDAHGVLAVPRQQGRRSVA